MIRESVDVYFKAKSVFKLGARTIRAGEPILIFDTVKTSTLDVAAEMSYVTGGRGNSRILSFEGDKVLGFQFEDALISAEGLAILSGADLIPARNKQLPGSSPEARSVISHYTEKYAVITNNIVDNDPNNAHPTDPSIQGIPRGGEYNVWLSRKPYVGQNSSIYVMLLDDAGEISGAPVEINLNNDNTDNKRSSLAKFFPNDQFITFGRGGQPMLLADYPEPTTAGEMGIFNDQAQHYVDFASAEKYWVTSWGDIADYTRTITATQYADDGVGYGWLLAPSGGISQPKCFKEGVQFVYKVNIPSVMYQDIVLIDYYVEYMHDATQITILPDKFAPFVYVEGSSLIRRASDGIDLPVEFVIPKFKITTALSFTMQSTGDPSTFTFQGDAYPDFSKFDLTRKVLADIQILDADDNYDLTAQDAAGDPTSYRRFEYDEDGNSYLWKDPSIEEHQNIDYSDTFDYVPTHGGAPTINPGKGLIDRP